MSDRSRNERYTRLLRDEQVAFEWASRHSQTASPDRRKMLARNWFAAQAKVLMEYHRSHLLPAEGGPLEPFPADALGRAAKISEALVDCPHRVVRFDC